MLRRVNVLLEGLLEVGDNADAAPTKDIAERVAERLAGELEQASRHGHLHMWRGVVWCGVVWCGVIGMVVVVVVGVYH